MYLFCYDEHVWRSTVNTFKASTIITLHLQTTAEAIRIYGQIHWQLISLNTTDTEQVIFQSGLWSGFVVYGQIRALI